MNYLKTLVFAITVMALLAFGELSNVKKVSYDAYLSGSINLWKQSVQMAKRHYDQYPSDQSRFELVLSEYGLLNATLKDQDKDTFNEYIDNAIERCKELIKDDIHVAESKAIVSAMTGLKIAYSPWKGMFLGPKSSSYISEAMTLDPRSPIVQQLYGNHQNFTPEMWGGNPDNAIEAYQRAISIYEEKRQTDQWMYLDAHAWLGIVQKKQGRLQEAIAVWEKIVEKEPDFGWVKYNLIPSVKSTTN